MKVIQKLPPLIRQYICIYGVVLVVFSFFRLVLFVNDYSRLADSTLLMRIPEAFLMGLRFDLVISGYLLFFPFLIQTILSFFNKANVLVDRIVFYFLFVFFSITFIVCAVDIPYFHQFFSRFSITAFEWLDSPLFVFKMVMEEPRYWLVLIPLALVLFVFYKVLKNIILRSNRKFVAIPLYLNILFSLLFAALMFVGVRGRLEQKSPIRIGTAYFCNDPFLNQLGLNPNFTLMRSYLDSKDERNKSIALMDNKQAIRNVQQYLHIENADSVNPISRRCRFENSKPTNFNVVIVLMESMSAGKMSRHGNTNNLTPFLDSLSTRGYYFENAYSAGIHTFNGVFSTLFSMPALFRQHPMKESSIHKLSGIFNTLKPAGYSTIYFTTHDGQFDNVEGFLHANDCETVISQANYPASEIKTTLGVTDDYLFKYTVTKLDELAGKNKPFVAAVMTASDHGPYYIPDYYHARNKDKKMQATEFADYSLRNFIKRASSHKWFDNTIFVFVADHGASMDNTYDVSLNYNHVPLLFYAPKLLTMPKTFSNLAGQIDIFPTVMGLLGKSYINNTLGIDLLRETRPYMYFNVDDKYAVINQNWLVISKTDGSKGLYKYQSKDTRNYAEQYPDTLRKMDDYAKSNMQTFQYLQLKKSN